MTLTVEEVYLLLWYLHLDVIDLKGKIKVKYTMINHHRVLYLFLDQRLYFHVRRWGEIKQVLDLNNLRREVLEAKIKLEARAQGRGIELPLMNDGLTLSE
uniref:Uncharacterized protein n=1 Tax=Phlegmariurus squarrosus TaxID=73615 RepID=H9M889_PHLSQ|nr:hypothetical protein HusqMp117 [Phlegmariurus squarrosus]AEV55796.1 hypothetical protein HusqMp117 [Phlegmariurus squarrosus]